MTHKQNYCENIIKNFLILRPKSCIFKSPSSIATKMIYYKSSLVKNFKVSDMIYKLGSLIAKLFSGSWLNYTFIVFEFGNEGKISIDYTQQGLRITTDERIMENRNDTKIDC